MGWFKYRETATILWFLVFFHAGSFVVRDTRFFTDAAKASWSAWGRWSQCNVLNFGRETRFRNCIDSQGKSQRSTNCAGHARRTRQCESCQYPLLNRRRKTNAAIRSASSHTIIHSTGLSKNDSNTAWCSTRPFSANEYLEIAFENFVRFTAIATRGYNAKNRNGHVTEYKVQFSYNGKKWFPYESRGREVVFNGNTDATQLRKNNFERTLVARYIRVYPTKYETSLCLDVELYGCEFNCGGLITNDVVRVNAPDSAQIEEPSCLWRIESPEATKIQLSFPYFKLLCREGFLQIVDGASPFIDGQMFEELCGESRRISPLEFIGREIWLHYRAYASTDIGFRLQGNIYIIKTLNSSSAEIRVPGTDEFKHVFRYTWMITAPHNASILLTIHNFKSDNILRVNDKCVGDSLIIHNGTDIKNSLVNRLCDDQFPQILHSKTSYLRIKYRAASTKPRWKLHFSYKILESEVIPTHSTELLLQGRDDMPAPSTHPGNGSHPGNNTRLDVDAVQRKNSEKSVNNVPVIISSILAVVIAIVFLVALIHFLRRRKEFLKKHPYDCNTRPMSHFGDEDSTPFINQNVLMWSDSNCRKSDKEKTKKNSLPHITVALRDDSPQRLSIIPAEMLSGPPSENILGDNTTNASLVVSDAFTAECLQLLDTNFSSILQDENKPTKDEQYEAEVHSDEADAQSELENVQSDLENVQSDLENVQSDVENVQSDVENVQSDVEDVQSDVEDVQSEPEDPFDQNEEFSANSPEKEPAVVFEMPRDFPLTSPEIEKYLSWGKV